MPSENNRSVEVNSQSCILVIDDDHFLNELFSDFLQEKGFSTFSVYSLHEALEFIGNGKVIDLILLDYQLSDGTGIEFLERLNAKSPNNTPPVIMVSANEDPEFLEECFVCGVADYVIKPVNLSLLSLKVSALIRSISMQKLIANQYAELERFKSEAEREEAVAKFTYEYLLRQNSENIDGVSIWLKSSSSFSGDMAISKISPSGDLYFLLADATGHGLSAAITIMPVVAIFNSMVSKGFHIQSIVSELNRKLIHDTPQDRFVAAVVIQLRQDRKEIDVWNGGMPTVCWFDDGEIIEEFKSQHMALGILEDHDFDANVITVNANRNGTLVAYSDGLIEELNDEGELFSTVRVVDIIKNNKGDVRQGLISALINYTGRDNFKDDVSICSLIPNRIFKHCDVGFKRSLQCGTSRERISDFSWCIKITGNKIATSDIPPMCNKFLQYMDINQQCCQVIFVVVSEMVSNAIDHGVLKLDSSLKESENGFFLYFNERERRLQELTESDFIELSLQWISGLDGAELNVSVRDSGDGYSRIGESDELQRVSSGRGINLIKRLSKSVEIIDPGNLIKVVIKPF